MAPLTQLQDTSVRENILHHVSGMASGQWDATTTEQPTIQVPITGTVRCCASLEVLHQRDLYLCDALHRTNYASRCQLGTVPCIRLPSMQDFRGKWFPMFWTHRNRSCHLAACVDVLDPVFPPLAGGYLVVHCRSRPSWRCRKCCTGVSKCSCHVDSHKRWCCVHASRPMSSRCDYVTRSV